MQEVVSKQTRDDLALLKESKAAEDFYLGGGTGLAFLLGHRKSIDLDFFKQGEVMPKEIIEKMSRQGAVSIQKEAKDSLTCIFNKTKVSFFRYDYPVLFPFKDINGFQIADEKDIGCMKVGAISGRGGKKDFIDIFFISKKIVPLNEILLLFEKKYQRFNYNLNHILKSLVYFEDAETEPMPEMIIPVKWKDVKSFFQREVKSLLK